MENSKNNIETKTFQKEKSITLEGCPQGGEKCNDLLKKVNNLLFLSNQHMLNKDFIRALEMKEKAFNETVILQSEHCFPCGGLFRKFIYDAVNDYILEMEKMSKGLFRKKKYAGQLKKAGLFQKSMKEYIDRHCS